MGKPPPADAVVVGSAEIPAAVPAGATPMGPDDWKRLANRVLTSKPAPGAATVAGWSGALYGGGYILGRNTLVWHGQTGSGAPGNPGTCLWLMDAATGKRTGVAFLGDTKVAHASRPGGVAGGCSASLQTVNGKPRMVITTLAQGNDRCSRSLGFYRYDPKIFHPGENQCPRQS